MGWLLLGWVMVGVVLTGYLVSVLVALIYGWCTGRGATMLHYTHIHRKVVSGAMHMWRRVLSLGKRIQKRKQNAIDMVHTSDHTPPTCVSLTPQEIIDHPSGTLEISLGSVAKTSRVSYDAQSSLTKEQKKTIKKILREASFLKDKGQLEQYEKKLIEGLAVAPQHQECNRLLAGLYAKMDNITKAISLLKKLLERYPKDHEVLRQLADIYLQQELFDEAHDLLVQAIHLASDRPKYYVSMVEVLYNTDRLEEATVFMQKAVMLRPNNVHYLIALGELYEGIGDEDHAKKYYFQVLEHEPSNVSVKKKLASL